MKYYTLIYDPPDCLILEELKDEAAFNLEWIKREAKIAPTVAVEHIAGEGDPFRALITTPNPAGIETLASAALVILQRMEGVNV